MLFQKTWKVLLLGCSICLFSFIVYAPDAVAQPAPKKMVVKDVIALAKLGYTEAQIIREIDNQRMRGRFRLSTRDVMSLRRAGVSFKVIQMMKGSGGAARSTVSRTPIGGRVVRVARAGRFTSTVKVRIPKGRRYTHVTKRFSIKVPRGWRVLEHIASENAPLSVYLTPGRTSQVNRLKRAVSIQVFHQDQSRTRQSPSLLDAVRQSLDQYLTREPKMRLISKFKSSTFQKNKSVTVQVKGKESKRRFRVRVQKLYIQGKNVTYSVSIVAAKSQFSSFLRRARKVLASLKLMEAGQHRAGFRLKTAQTVQKIIQQNTKAVVSISVQLNRKGKTVYRASGSGFVVTSNGYVITNHHVAMNARTKKPYKSYTLNWDRGTKLPSVKAYFVSAYYQYPQWRRIRLQDPKTGRISVRYQRQHVDIALLKIKKPGNYPYAKMTSIKDGLLGDTVVAMGFPLEGRGVSNLGNEDITATTGRISRLVRLRDRRVNEIQHTAKIAGGNSGGPLFDPNTGGVIGINTWVGVFDKKEKRPGMGLGYYYALPIDLAWQYFPDFLDHPKGGLQAAHWYSLGNLWRGMNRNKAAKRAFRRAFKLQKSFTPAYVKLASIFLSESYKYGDTRQTIRLIIADSYAKTGLKYSPQSTVLLRIRAQIALNRRRYSLATSYIQTALRYGPSEWKNYALRALISGSRGNNLKAIGDADQAVRLAGPYLPNAHMIRGRLLYNAKRYSEGQAAYRKAKAIAPGSMMPQLMEAMGDSYQKRHNSAISKFLALEKQFPHEPKLYRYMLLVYLQAKKGVKAWKSFQSYMQSCVLRQITPTATMYYVGGTLASKYLSKKIRYRVVWGLWSVLMYRYAKTSIAALAAKELIKRAKRLNMHGLSYAIASLFAKNSRSRRNREYFMRVQRRIGKRGMSQRALLFFSLLPVPRVSPSLLLKFFLAGPTILRRKTARIMMKKRVPLKLLAVMWRISKRRLRGGYRPNNRNSGSSSYRAMDYMVRRAMSALRSGNVKVWMNLHDPRGARSRYRAKFYKAHRMIRNRRLSFYSLPSRRVRIYRHRRYGKVYRYYFRARLRNGPKSYFYWEFRRAGSRWMMF